MRSLAFAFYRIFGRKPASTPDQVRGRLFPENALNEKQMGNRDVAVAHSAVAESLSFTGSPRRPAAAV
jgi:hypothetical protein